MKLMRYGPLGAERPAIADKNGAWRDLSDVIDDIDIGILIEKENEISEISLSALPLVNNEDRIGCPVARVGKFIGVGLNYRDHAFEAGAEIPSEPVIFMKATSSLSGPYDNIIIPRGAEKVDWEVELGIVIGKAASYVSVDEALNHVAGVCVVNDVSERAYQLERGGQWDKGKSNDTFGPVGPWLVTLDEVPSLSDLTLWCDVNDYRMQSGNTRDMIFDVPFLIHYISHFMSLQPGDIISTGTPAGVGLGQNPNVWLKSGDIVSLGIAGLGQQRQIVQ